jgi:hypothetical protein
VITGILDSVTNKIYKVCAFSLLHLGGRQFNLKPYSKLFKKNAKMILDNEDKIFVLGLLAPALFFPSINRFESNAQDLKK